MQREPIQHTTSPDTSLDDNQRLAQRLREAREYLGLSQDFVADQIKIARAAVSAIETGNRKVQAAELKQFAQIYRRNVAYFLDEDEQPEDPTVNALFRTTKELSKNDKEQVLKFAQFLQHSGGGPRTSLIERNETDN